MTSAATLTTGSHLRVVDHPPAVVARLRQLLGRMPGHRTSSARLDHRPAGSPIR